MAGLLPPVADKNSPPSAAVMASHVTGVQPGQKATGFLCGCEQDGGQTDRPERVTVNPANDAEAARKAKGPLVSLTATMTATTAATSALTQP
jgi:hypothetical protein